MVLQMKKIMERRDDQDSFGPLVVFHQPDVYVDLFSDHKTTIA